MRDYSESYLIRKHPTLDGFWTYYLISVNNASHGGIVSNPSYKDLGETGPSYASVNQVVELLKSFNDNKGIILHQECNRGPSDVS